MMTDQRFWLESDTNHIYRYSDGTRVTSGDEEYYTALEELFPTYGDAVTFPSLNDTGDNGYNGDTDHEVYEAPCVHGTTYRPGWDIICARCEEK
jgi:hypothetical protein